MCFSLALLCITSPAASLANSLYSSTSLILSAGVKFKSSF
nr:MAG TPA: hypothetical protein [Caudoviricetes sp.]